jgi:hypothetical protein
VFGIRRKSRSELFRAELNESFDHFMQAATHAAGGVGATVGPRYGVARDYVTPPATKIKGAAANGWGTTVSTLAPLAAAASDGAKKAGKATSKAKGKAVSKMKKEPPKSSRRWPMMAGVAALAAVVGAGAMIARRRRQQQQWDEYDPGRALDPVASESTTTAGGMSTPGASATSTTGTAKSGKAGSMADKASDTAEDTAAKAEEKADDLLSDTSTRNSRS